ncbi:arylamine N-acetyltransferase [Bacillus sp. SM2101]|uniref:arylamine N-acetyltransferase family protein n=1 Tax=Bacillus sp. SM2101 TaxID=2805366 RepID=UPI001BDE0821|nr:arylamine N-acetyltransferase [Bacillus sp. SM2101]
MDITEYLERIKVDSLSGDQMKDLQLLIKQNIYNIPFENLDVIRRIPIKLDLEQIYRKVVINRRGGFCYELNGLFHWLLTRLGYEVKRISATVAKNKNEWYLQNTHLSNIVTINEREYLVDVGFGDFSHSPIPLDGEEVEDIGGTYRIERVNELFYDLQKIDSDDWLTKFRFNTEAREYLFFEEACQLNQSPASHYTKKIIVTKGNATGRITLTDHEVITTINGQKTKREYLLEERNVILQELFGINLLNA